jgi:hypothetical protein
VYKRREGRRKGDREDQRLRMGAGVAKPSDSSFGKSFANSFAHGMHAAGIILL